MENILRLVQLARIPNLVDMMSESELGKIADRAIREYEADDASRSDWVEISEKAMDSALQVVKEKTYPWPGAANITVPFLTVAAVQFHARAYPAVVQNGQVVKGKVTGEDRDGQKLNRAERVAKHMNYQLTEEMPEWDEQMDAMLLALPIEGCEFKKTLYSTEKGRNVSDWIRPKDFVVSNSTKSLDDCPRATHVIEMYPHKIQEAQRAGVFADVDINMDTEDEDEETPQCVLEQHRLIDMDEDGIKEPYIVTIHKESAKILRIKPNWEASGIIVKSQESVHPAFIQEGAQIQPHEQFGPGCTLVKIDPEQYFTKYSFIPNPAGGFYDIGFGQLIGPLGDACNSIINRLLDAGTLANQPMGFISEGMKLAGQAQGGGEARFKPGEFKKVKASSASRIADQVYQIQVGEPSLVLFQLLGFVSDQITSITAVKDIMVGKEAGGNTPVGTTMAMIEQGMKVFSAIYKRIYRALNKELAKIKRLNSIYLPIKDYFRVVDSPEPLEIQIFDYQGDETDVQPVADASMATTMQRMARAQFALQFSQGNPLINPMEVTKMVLEASDLPVDRLLVTEPPQPPPDPKMIETQAKVEKMAAETKEIYAKIMEMAQKLEFEGIRVETNQLKTEIEALKQMGEVDGNIMEQLEAPTGDGGVLQGDFGQNQGMPGIPIAGPGEFDPNAG